jgi:hypothetical protein
VVTGGVRGLVADGRVADSDDADAVAGDVDRDMDRSLHTVAGDHSR